MKKLFLIMAMLLFSSSIFAGYSSNERNKCRWYAKKYATNARTFSGYPAWDHDGDCSTAYSELIKYCVFQKVSRGVNGFWQQGAVSQSICSRGEIVSSFDQFFLPQPQSLTGNIEESELNAKPSVFDEDNHTITISGITGSIKLQKDNGFYSKMRFSIWKPTDDVTNGVEDETMENNEVLHQFEIQVTDNGVLFNGNLANNDLNNQFTIHDDGKEISVTFTDVSITVPIDSSVSLDDLAVMIDGDGAPDTESNSAKMSSNTDLSVANKDFSLNIYPNPSSDFLNIDFSNNLSSGNTSILIYNTIGKKIDSFVNEKLEKNSLKSIKLNISNYPKGNYYILIDSNGKKLTKQFIKN